MDYRTTKFDLECVYLNYYLGIRNNIDVDYWLMKSPDNYINWHCTILDSPQGIHNINAYCKNVRVQIGYRVDKDDLTTAQELNLIQNFNGVETTYHTAIEGVIDVITLVDPAWQIEWSCEFDKGLYPKELNINFIDKYMEVI